MDRSAEHALIRRAKEGDEEAVEALIRAHQDALYAFILRMSGRPETAEDIVQEALVRVLSNLHRFDSRYRFSTWLFTIAKRLYVNLSQKLGPAYDTDMVEVSPISGRGPGWLAARAETMDDLRHLIDAALAALPRQQREIMLLFHQQSWPIARIAEHLQMPQGTVKSHLHRGRGRMRRFIEANRSMHRQVEEVLS
ncbi:MAG: RNA polymerase sigma factor [Planctomycetota bacterium]|jgi:RNA polymerase sigma-70 factor (ECF subfamily)